MKSSKIHLAARRAVSALTESLEPRRLLTTYTVDTAGDSIADDGVTSLREAIIAANANPNSVSEIDKIEFDIPGAGPHTINLNFDGIGELVVTDPVFIDGYSQTGASKNTKATGSDAVLKILISNIDGEIDRNGLRLASGSDGSTVAGLAFTGTDMQAGIAVLSNGNYIVGNFLGLKPDGNADFAVTTGVELSGNGNHIGTSNPGDRNVIAGGFAGAFVHGIGNVVQGNYIGTNPAGTASRLGGHGVYIANEQNLIGGTAPGQGNLISGATGGKAGVFIEGLLNVVQGNRIGTDATGANPLGNTYGILLSSAASTDNLIGGTVPGAGNLIAYNGTGVVAYGTGDFDFPVRNAILSNSMYGNTTIGIDLDASTDSTIGDGWTANDSFDGDEGANELTNAPEITSAVHNELNDQTDITGLLEAKPNTAYTIQIFSHPLGEDFTQGHIYLGRVNIVTNSNGVGVFTFSIDGIVAEGDKLTATATIKTATGYADTSEMGPPISLITNFTPPTVVVDSSNDDEGDAGSHPFLFRVSLSKYSPYPVTVYYHTEDNGATAGIDYETKTASLTIAPGNSSGGFGVVVYGDTTFESDEQFKVVIDSVSNGTDGTGTAYGKIVNDDPAPSASVTLQSEVQTLSGGTTKQSNHAGFTGTGFADYGGNGSGVTYALSNTQAGTGNLTFRYANGSAGNRPVQVLVNNVVVGTLTGAPTGGWSNWTDATLTGVSLPAGALSIKALANTGSGGANYDKLTVTGAGVQEPAPPAPADVTIQAENGTFAGGTGKQSNHTGFTGTGFADFGGNGSSASYVVNRSASSIVDLTIRYANGSATNRPLQVLFNNVVVGTLNFAPTGGWNTWVNTTLTGVALTAGNVTVKLVATTAAGGANLDSLKIAAAAP